MLRTLLAGGWTLLLVLLCAPVGLIASWVSGSAGPLYAIAFPAVRSALQVAGIRVQIHGRERLDPDRPYLFVSNHVSNVDPPVLLVAIGRRIRVLAKDSVFRIPLFGAVLRRAGMVPIHRDDRERSFRAVDAAAEALAAGHDFLVFAEGTRSLDGRLQPLKKGPFVMALKAGVPVVPVAIRGSGRIQPKGSPWIRPGVVAVHFLDPVPTAGLTLGDRDDLRLRVHGALAAALDAPAGSV